MIKVQHDKSSGDYWVDLNEFKDIINVSNVVYYGLDDNGDGSISIKFYDKDRDLIPLNDIEGK